jgi:ATP-dependent Zn protease
MSDLRCTAYHETGHSVAAFLLNKRFTSISIVSDGEIVGRVTSPLAYTRDLF